MASITLNLLKEQGATKLFYIFLLLTLLILFVFLITFKLSKPAMVTLFSGLNRSDSVEILDELESEFIEYEIRKGGAEIVVPANKVLETRMKMAKKNLPNGNAIIGYEIFDRSENLGVSSFVYNVNLKRALEGELSRTISSFKDVKRAKVHLVIPTQNLFSKSHQKPTASVILEMFNNKMLALSEIASISHLVATAVPGLNIKDITIVDTQGRALKKGVSSEDDLGILASTSDEYKAQYEKRIKSEVEQLLETSLGYGSVEVQVSAEMDFDRIITDSEIFDPEGQVVRSVQTVEEKEASNDDNGNVTVQNNIPEGQNQNTSGSSNKMERVDEVTNFEVSKTTKKYIKQAGSIKRLTVAVLVDGKYTFDKEVSEYIYSPRTKEEIIQIEKLTKSAIGFNDERGDLVEVVNMKFSKDAMGSLEEGNFDWLKRDLSAIVKTLITGIVVILIVLLVIKPIINKIFESVKSEVDEASASSYSKAIEIAKDPKLIAEEESDLAFEDIQEEDVDLKEFAIKKKASVIDKINEFIEENPKEFVMIMRQVINKDSSK